jgi:S-adenosyl methyltransferase
MTGSSATPSQELISKLNAQVPHSARIWNYWLGGKDNFPADREVGDQVRTVFPAIVENAQASRAFLGRAVRYLAGEAGIRQFLDIGTGLPTANNTHQVAQQVAPECRIVYVDNDPLVLAHARALLTSSPEGATDYIDADVRDTDKILQEAAHTLDFTQPVAIMMLGILGNVADYDLARSIVKRLLDGVPSGSYLVINDGTNTSEEIVEGARVSGEGGHPYTLRSPEEIAAFFDGLDLQEPGVVSTPRWRPEPSPSGPPAELDGFCGVARKP